MRTLGEIVDMAKDGRKPEYDELRYAVVALAALQHFDMNGLRRVRKLPTLAAHEHEESWRRLQTAYNKPPKDYVGAEHDPDDPEVQARIRASRKLFEKIASGELKPNAKHQGKDPRADSASG